jgi:alkanesulfonate monooxygenase SsuD/methylene tetrahydromethanopterin reductase-like flavin-dependent oxidoreductase (luciferase family)
MRPDFIARFLQNFLYCVRSIASPPNCDNAPSRRIIRIAAARSPAGDFAISFRCDQVQHDGKTDRSKGRGMQFGLFGGARTKRGVGLEDSQGYESFIEYVIEADRLGFRQFFMVEHHFTGQGQVSASMTLLAYLAARTRTIRLGTAVVVLPWHNPVLVAEQVATLDLLSGGRVDFGIGKGYRQAEFDGFCIPMAEATERFDEAAEIIRKAWTTPHDKDGGRFSHHGKRWHYDNIVVEPAPVQRPHPPLWLAAGSHDSIRRAAREGYNLLLDQLAQIDQITQRIAIFREECEKTGRPYHANMVATARPLQMIHDESEREAAYATRKRVVNVIGDLARDTLPDRIEDDTAPLLGTPDEVIARLKQLEAGGATNILLVDPNASVGNLRAFAREVMPAFQPARAVNVAD